MMNLLTKFMTFEGDDKIVVQNIIEKWNQHVTSTGCVWGKLIGGETEKRR